MRGLLCHLLVAPFVAISLLVIGLLMSVRMGESDSLDAPDLPHHPAGDMLLTEGGGTIALLFLLAVVAAPIVEETMFRGVLYRHLRDCSRGPRWLRVVISMAVGALVFAVIHPQGALGAPPLMIVAVGFAIAREWRNSVFPSMYAHAFHNSIVLTVGLATG